MLAFMTPDEFRAHRTEPAHLTPPLSALWHDAKDDWEAAHRIVQDDDSRDAAWVHAYLHRREGDISNARYWYARARRPEHHGPLEAEWQEIAEALLRSSRCDEQ